MKQLIQKTWMVTVILCTFLSSNAYDFEADGLYYEVLSVPELTCMVVSGDVEYSGDIIIPSEVTYKDRNFKVTTICGQCFVDCKSLTSIEIGESVTIIGWEAFRGCSGLTNIIIPNSVTTIVEKAFERCTSLSQITLSNSLATIEKGVFWGCSSLKKIIIPNSVTSIEKNAFESCKGLESIELSNQLKSIGMEAFEYCESLQGISIPGSVDTIEWGFYEQKSSGYHGDLTFYGCNNLKEMKFLNGSSPLTVEYLCTDYHYNYQLDPLEIERLYIDRELNWGVYSDLPFLKELTFGPHLSKCSKDFYQYDGLTTIISYAMLPPEVSEFSNHAYMDAIVRVPKEALEDYQQAEIWKNFWNIEALEDSGVIDVKNESSSKSVIGWYNMNGRVVSEDYEGLVIVRFSDGTCKKMLNRQK